MQVSEVGLTFVKLTNEEVDWFLKSVFLLIIKAQVYVSTSELWKQTFC